MKHGITFIELLLFIAVIFILSSIGSVFVGCSEFSTLCYDKWLGYNDVCNTNGPYYNNDMCTKWQEEAYDESTNRYDNNYKMGPVRECLDNVEVN